MIYSKKSGLSLPEMLMVLSVMTIILYIIVPRIMKYTDKINEGKAKLVLATLQEAVSQYEFDLGHPPSRQDGGLNALITRPGRGAEEWHGPYVTGQEEVPKDPWNNDYHYNVAPNLRFKKYYKKYEIFSYGSNPEEDISNKLRVGA